MTPLRQFRGVPPEIIRKAEVNQVMAQALRAPPTVAGPGASQVRAAAAGQAQAHCKEVLLLTRSVRLMFKSSASRWVVDATASNTSPLRSTSPAGHPPPPGCPQVMRLPVSSRCVHMTPSSYSQVPQLTNAPAVFSSCAKTRATRATQRHSDNDLGKAQQVQAYSQQHATLVRVPADTSSSGEQAQPEENLSA